MKFANRGLHSFKEILYIYQFDIANSYGLKKCNFRITLIIINIAFMVFKNTYLGYNIFLIRVTECKYHGIEVHKRKLFLKKIYIC